MYICSHKFRMLMLDGIVYLTVVYSCCCYLFFAREILKAATLTLIVINRLQAMDVQHTRKCTCKSSECVCMASFLRSCHKWQRQLEVQ